MARESLFSGRPPAIGQELARRRAEFTKAKGLKNARHIFSKIFFKIIDRAKCRALGRRARLNTNRDDGHHKAKPHPKSFLLVSLHAELYIWSCFVSRGGCLFSPNCFL